MKTFNYLLIIKTFLELFIINTDRSLFVALLKLIVLFPKISLRGLNSGVNSIVIYKKVSKNYGVFPSFKKTHREFFGKRRLIIPRSILE